MAAVARADLHLPEYLIKPSKFYNTEVGLVDNAISGATLKSGFEIKKRKHRWNDRVLVKVASIDEAMHSSLQVIWHSKAVMTIFVRSNNLIYISHLNSHCERFATFRVTVAQPCHIFRPPTLSQTPYRRKKRFFWNTVSSANLQFFQFL